MAHHARAGWLALLIAALGGALALGLPTARPGDGRQSGFPRSSRIAAPNTILLTNPALLDAQPDDAGGLSLLLAADGSAAGQGSLRLLTLEAGTGLRPPQPQAANPSSRSLEADAAWLVDGTRVVTWRATAPGQLVVTDPATPGSRVKDAGKPALVTTAPSEDGGRAAILLVLPGSGPVAPGGQNRTVVPQAAGQSPPAAKPEGGDSDGSGDRVLRVAAGQREILRLSTGVVTALAAGRDGAVAAAWVEPGRPPTAGLTLINSGGQTSWQTTLREPAHRLTILPGSVVVAAVGSELMAVREGKVIWRRPLAGPAIGLATDGQGRVLVALAGALLSLTNDGFTTWELTPRAPVRALRAAPAGTWAALVEAGQVELFSVSSRPDGGEHF